MIHRATHRVGLYLADLRERGLTQGEAHILAHLAASGPASIAELHGGLAHRRSTLTSILDRLSERGLITREVGTPDRRTFVIRPTARGRSAARRVLQHLAVLERSVLAAVTAGEVGGCSRVLAAVEDHARQRTERRGTVRPNGPRRGRLI